MVISILLLVIMSLGQSALGEVLEQRDPCTASCAILGKLQKVEWRKQKYGTRDEDGNTHSFDKTRTGTFYIITVINTVKDTTSVVTSQADVYDAYTPPLTNSDGTMMHVHTYTFKGKTKTTTIAYPTPFFEWPDQYGIQRFSDSTGECIGTNATIEITSEPQPSGPFEIDETDPLGWGHTLVPGTSGDRLLQSSVALLPDLSSVPHAEVKACKAGGDTGPDFYAQFHGSWKVVAVSTTITEGGAGKTTVHATTRISSATTSGNLPSRTPQHNGSATDIPAQESLGERSLGGRVYTAMWLGVIVILVLIY